MATLQNNLFKHFSNIQIMFHVFQRRRIEFEFHMIMRLISSHNIGCVTLLCLDHNVSYFAWLRCVPGVGGVHMDPGELAWIRVFNPVNRLVADHDGEHELAIGVNLLGYCYVGPGVQRCFFFKCIPATLSVSANGRVYAQSPAGPEKYGGSSVTILDVHLPKGI